MFYKIIFSLFIFFLFSCNEKSDEIYEAKNIEENVNYTKAWHFLDSNNKDSAFYYFQLSKEDFRILKDDIGEGKCLMNMAIIQSYFGDNFGAQESAIMAVHMFEGKDNDYLSATYNCLGVTSDNLKNFSNSKNWYNKAIKSSKITDDIFAYKNNFAVVHIRLKEYDKAIDMFENLKLSNYSKTNIKYKITILDNLAYTKFLQRHSYNAEPELYKALEIREREKDLWGQNASHAHLSDYFAEKNPKKALFHAYKMYRIAQELNSPDDQLEALQKLINLDNQKNTKSHFKIYQSLSDSLQTARNQAKNQFALIRYETEKNRADLLKSQAENTEKNYQILKRNVLIFTILGLSAFSGTVAVFWYRRRKKMLEKEKELEVKNTQLQYAKKVHDVVCNGIYNILTEVENSEYIEKDHLMNKLDLIYEKSRDISYDEPPVNLHENYADKISQLLNSYTSNQLYLTKIGLQDINWHQVDAQTRSEIELVLQELMTNMKKHSQATAVRIEFEKQDANLLITYFDNGIGLPKENFTPKNGLKNTENRISSCGGIVIFDRNLEKGTKIKISVPV